MKVLAGGSGDITTVMPILARVLLKSSRKVSLRVEEADAERIAILTVGDVPVTRTISVLESLTISGSRGDQIQRSIVTESISGDTDTSATPTRFIAADAPIHEVRIQGNRKVPEARIQQTLENGSEDLEKALKSLFKAMPYFEEVHLQVDAENSQYIATITVDEKPLSTDMYLGLSPTARLGFNRVTGWEVGTGFEVGRREDIGPLWMWNIREFRDRSNLKTLRETGVYLRQPALPLSPRWHGELGKTLRLKFWTHGTNSPIDRCRRP